MTDELKKQATSTAGFIRAYGMFWHADQVTWSPGQGRGNRSELLGRLGKQAPKLRIVNFWAQQGIYVLYNDYGAYYVGRTSGATMNLGKRLRQHALGLNGSPHADRWDRFSWFGWRGVLGGGDNTGLRNLKKVPRQLLASSSDTVRDIEVLLIHGLGTKHLGGNAKDETFAAAVKWEQVLASERAHYLAKVKP